VLVYGGQRSLPALHLVAASDVSAAAAVADDLLAQSSSGIGVEVVCEGKRLYVRGVVPAGRANGLAEVSTGLGDEAGRLRA
jgi:hypothetical protein